MGLITLEASTGLQSFTGVGFMPEALMLFGVLLDPANPDQFEDEGILHVGMAVGGDQWAGGGHTQYLSDNKSSYWNDDAIVASVLVGVLAVEATLDSFDADGFTLDVTTAPPTDIRLVYFAMEGQGGYAIGTDQAPTGTGNQAITGLGFQPAAVFFASTSQPALGVNTGYFKPMFGGGDATESYAAWTGMTQGDPYCDSVAYKDACLLFMTDADAGGPFQPTTDAEAELISLDADGFTLDWNVADGTGRYFSWFAVEEGEIGRWEFNDGLNKPVPTAEKSEGLLFFMNHRGVDTRDDGHNPPGGTYGATLAIGVCDQNLSQNVAGFVDIDRPDFSVPQNAREIFIGDAFGAYAQEEEGLAANDMGNRGRIISLIPRGWVPQIYRRVVEG